MGFVYARAGQPEAARELLTKLQEAGGHRYVPAIYYAAVHSGLRETEQAVKYLERAVDERNWEIAWLHVDPFWDEIRADPRFQHLQAQLGLAASFGQAR